MYKTGLDSRRCYACNQDVRFAKRPGGCVDLNGSVAEGGSQNTDPRSYEVESHLIVRGRGAHFLFHRSSYLTLFVSYSSSLLNLSPRTMTRTPLRVVGTVVVRAAVGGWDSGRDRIV